MPDERIILCLNCGQQNRLKAKGRPNLARCGRCGEPLAPLLKSWSGARRFGLISLLLATAAGGVGYLVYGYEPAPTRLSLEEVYGAASESKPEAATVPVPEPKPRSTFADVSCEVTARPTNGTVILQLGKGPHELIMVNGTSADAIVKLRDNRDRDVASFYIHDRSTSKLHDVPEGEFKILFATGRSYSKECDKFIIDFKAWRFPGTHSFESKIEGDFIYTTAMEFTLHEVIQGNISRQRIPDSVWFNG